MSIDFIRPEVDELRPRISVIGVGGAGGNAIANMIAAEVQGVDFIVANTDAQALNALARRPPDPARSRRSPRVSAPARGRRSAAPPPKRRSIEIEQALEGAHMCFIAAGMGGGTGTGAAPVIAKAARDRGILTVGVVTKPFSFEGARRARAAEAGIEELQQHVDTLIVIPNQNLFRIANPNTTFKEAFMMADEVLQQGVRGITDLMVMPGLINLDFADVRSVMSEMGKAMMGTGEADGDNRAIEAAEQAIANPLLDGVSMKGAKGVIISITGGEDMRLMEVDEAANHIRELVDPDANIIWGSAFNNDLDGKIRVSVVATGIDVEEATPGAAASGQGVRLPGRARGRAAPGRGRTTRRRDPRPRRAAAADPEPMVSAPRITLTPPEPWPKTRRWARRTRSRSASSTSRPRRRPNSPSPRLTKTKATSCCSIPSISRRMSRPRPMTRPILRPGAGGPGLPRRPAPSRRRSRLRARVAPCSSACRTSPAAPPRPRSTRKKRGLRGNPRPARHSEVPQPAEQPVIPSST